MDDRANQPQSRNEGDKSRLCENHGSLADLKAERGIVAQDKMVAPIGIIEGVRYFAPAGAEIQLREKADGSLMLVPPRRPLNVAIATSIRDVGSDDQCGRTVRIRNDKGGAEEVYMKGALEHLIAVTKGEAGKFFQVGLIIVDDVPNSTDRIPEHSIVPGCANVLPWIAPHDLATHGGETVDSLVQHLPSAWRKIPRNQTSRRMEQKYSYEKQIESVCQERGIDLILSDHLLIHLEHLHKGAFAGKVLNIHPGITWEGDLEDSCRGLTPTKLALEKAASRRGSGKSFTTGATLHYIADEMDGGPPICDTKRTPVLEYYDTVTLRYYNYQLSKLYLIEKGLCFYAAHHADIVA